MNTFAKVQGHESLVRDMSSHAILVNNDTSYEAYKRSRDKDRKQRELIEQQAKEMESLKNDMQEIKQMITLLIKGK